MREGPARDKHLGLVLGWLWVDQARHCLFFCKQLLEFCLWISVVSLRVGPVFPRFLIGLGQVFMLLVLGGSCVRAFFAVCLLDSSSAAGRQPNPNDHIVLMALGRTPCMTEVPSPALTDSDSKDKLGCMISQCLHGLTVVAFADTGCMGCQWSHGLQRT